MEGQVRTQVSPCEICGGAKWNWDRFFSKFFSFLSISFYCCSIFTHVSFRGQTIGPLVATVLLRQSRPFSTIKTTYYPGICLEGLR
jgi:hypothetical protein